MTCFATHARPVAVRRYACVLDWLSVEEDLFATVVGKKTVLVVAFAFET